MYDRMQTIDPDSKVKIHEASMAALERTGVAFNDSEALDIFQRHGFKIEGHTVFFRGKDILNALETAPSRFKVHARAPEKSLYIGEEDLVFLPAYGALFITMADGSRRSGTMDGYDNFFRLV